MQIYLELISKTNIWKKWLSLKEKQVFLKRNMRRSHDSLGKINVILDKDSGEPRLSHKIDLSTGMYKGRLILKKKTKENN